MVGTNIGCHWVSLGVIGGHSIESFREFSTDHFSPLLCSECSVAYNAIVLLLIFFSEHSICFGIFEDFSFRMFWNIRRLLFSNILFLFRTFLSTEQQKYCYLQPSSLHFLITTKSKQNAVSRYKHSFIDASDEFHNVRARRTLLEGSFLTSCFILSLSLSLCGFCFDLQRSAIKNGRYLGLF